MVQNGIGIYNPNHVLKLIFIFCSFAIRNINRVLTHQKWRFHEFIQSTKSS